MAEKEELLQKQFQEMEALKVEVTVAKTNTQKKQEEAQVWYYFVCWEFVRIPEMPSLFDESFRSCFKGIIKICLLIPLAPIHSLWEKRERKVGRKRNC